MKRADISNRQIKILQELAEELKKEDDVVELIMADDENPIDSVVVEHEDMGVANDTVLGQYYYLPGLIEESQMEKFQINILLGEDMEDDKKAIMLQAVAYVNCLIPTGNFSIDPSLDSVSFRRGVNVMTAMDEKDELELLKFEIADALQMVSMFVAPLLALMAGDISWEEFIEACSMSILDNAE